jgi:diamine N-acetyltransferase
MLLPHPTKPPYPHDLTDPCHLPARNHRRHRVRHLQTAGLARPRGLRRHFEPKAWFRAIHADETPVGFVMLSLDPALPEYYIWRFMIDTRYQHLGYGTKALRLIIDHIRALPRAKEILVSCVPADGSPEPFYRKAGFIPTGQVMDGEVVLKLVL